MSDYTEEVFSVVLFCVFATTAHGLYAGNYKEIVDIYLIIAQFSVMLMSPVIICATLAFFLFLYVSPLYLLFINSDKITKMDVFIVLFGCILLLFHILLIFKYNYTIYTQGKMAFGVFSIAVGAIAVLGVVFVEIKYSYKFLSLIYVFFVKHLMR